MWSLTGRYTSAGKQVGMEKGADKLAELIKMGFSVDEALRKVKENKAP